MQFIEEVVVDEFLPTVRSMLAERLSKQDFTQQEIADILGISQSAVSKYIHNEIDTNEQIRDHPHVQEIVEEISEGLASDTMSNVQALVELEILIRELESGDVLATLHEERMPALTDYNGKRIHDPESRLRLQEQTLASLRRGLRMLETTSGFSQLIPNVGSNLVSALPDADDVSAIAGVPGRIFDIKGQTTIPAEPEFGVSEYVATVLLAAQRGGSDARAALNIAYSQENLAHLRDAGHEAVEFNPELSAEVAVQEAIEKNPSATIVYQTGDVGVEPIIYILGDTPPTVAETVRPLC